MQFLEKVNGIDQMKIYEVITKEAWINLPPEEAQKQKQMADMEFRALKGIDSPDSQKLADAFRNAFARTGTVDSAYELARSLVAKMNVEPTAVRDFEVQAKRFSSAIKGGVSTGRRSQTQTIFNPGKSDKPAGGRGWSDQTHGHLRKDNKFKTGAKAVGDWIKDYMPYGKEISKVASAGADVAKKAVTPISKTAKATSQGYKFLSDPDAYSQFRQTRRKSFTNR